MTSRRIVALLFGAVLLFACADDDALVAMVDRIEVEVGGAVEFDPVDNDVWDERPDLVGQSFDESGVVADVVDGSLVIRNDSLPAGSVLEVPYSIDLDGRTARSVVVVVVPDDEPPDEPFVDPAALDFGTVVLTDDSTASELRLPIDVWDIADDDRAALLLTLDGPEVFSLLDSCSNPSPSCIADVAFAPKGEGSWTGVVDVKLASGEPVGSVALAASAVLEEPPPAEIHAFELSRSSINLGSREVGGAELSGSVAITNTGTESLSLNASSSDSVEAKLGCSDPLPPTQSCQLNVFVDTRAAKTVAETITVFAPQAESVELSVRASVVEPPPILDVSFDPPVVELNLDNTAAIVMVTNVGDADLRNVRVEPGKGPYTISRVRCSGVLTVGDSCDFRVAISFDALAFGAPLDAGDIVLAADEFSERLEVQVDTTQPPDPKIVLEPERIQFLDNNEPRSVTIENTGNVALRGLRISKTGLDGELGPFTVTNSGSCNGDNEIAPGETCQFEFQLDQLPAGFNGFAVVDRIDVNLGDATARLAVQIGVQLI